jgi:predicted acetyltransferase
MLQDFLASPKHKKKGWGAQRARQLFFSSKTILHTTTTMIQQLRTYHTTTRTL